MTIETFAIGLLVSCLFVELTGFYPGGLIVPAYFAAYLDQPLRVLGTAIIALITWIIYRLLAHWFIIFGHRRFVLLVALSATFGVLGCRVLPIVWPSSADLRVIGWVIPGLLANAFERQGIWLSVCGLVVASVITYFLVRLINV
ncbi:MAG: poly-gamma-glutamate biosynthesis protein PgsC [Candidatus Methanomethyliaceae archaeon]